MRKLPKFDLTTKCTECGYAIPPAEILRTGWHIIGCPKCGKGFHGLKNFDDDLEPS